MQLLALSGQSVGIIDSIKSAEDIINDTIKEFNETCSKLGGIKTMRSFNFNLLPSPADNIYSGHKVAFWFLSLSTP